MYNVELEPHLPNSVALTDLGASMVPVNNVDAAPGSPRNRDARDRRAPVAGIG